MAANINHLWFPIFILLSCTFNVSPSAAVTSGTCQYNITVKTGWYPGAGTDSKISLKFAAHDPTQTSPIFLKMVEIKNLKFWGIEGKGHNYFERASDDKFTVNGATCLEARICYMLLKSDGSGDRHPWYVNSVDVYDQLGNALTFPVNQWLEHDDETGSLGLQAAHNYCGQIHD